MQIVIDVPGWLYNAIMECKEPVYSRSLGDAVRDGTPLPKGHGKLVDVNSVPEEDRDIIVKSLLHPGTIAFAGAVTLEEYVNDLPTIIEADKAENEDGKQDAVVRKGENE